MTTAGHYAVIGLVALVVSLLLVEWARIRIRSAVRDELAGTHDVVGRQGHWTREDLSQDVADAADRVLDRLTETVRSEADKTRRVLEVPAAYTGPEQYPAAAAAAEARPTWPPTGDYARPGPPTGLRPAEPRRAAATQEPPPPGSDSVDRSLGRRARHGYVSPTTTHRGL